MYHVEIRYGLEDNHPASQIGVGESSRQVLSFRSRRCSELVRFDEAVEGCEGVEIVGIQENQTQSPRYIVVLACCYRWL